MVDLCFDVWIPYLSPMSSTVCPPEQSGFVKVSGKSIVFVSATKGKNSISISIPILFAASIDIGIAVEFFDIETLSACNDH